MVSGVSVQQYAEDPILHGIQTAFDRLFKLRFWPSYSEWATWTLDGTTGKVTTDLTSLVKDFTDIANIWYGSDTNPLTRRPTYTNPANITGTRPRYWEPLKQEPTRIFRILPITSTGNVTAYYRTKPADFDIDSTLYLDPLLLELASALAYLASDNANPTMINLVQEELKTYFSTVDMNHDDDEIELDANAHSIPENWYAS
jgi:hypothetical protein